MARRSHRRALGLVAAVLAGLLLSATPGQAAVQSPSAKPATGSVQLAFGPTFVQQMFTAGVFIYGASSVTVRMGDSGSLSATFPPGGRSTAAPTSLIRTDGENGGLTFINGPAGATAALGSLVVRRTGGTGVVTGEIVGPFSSDTRQFAQTMPVFTLSSARAKASGSGWSMTAHMALTDQGAATLNTLLSTSIFRAGARIGSLSADVSTG